MLEEKSVIYTEYKKEDYNGFLHCINEFYQGGYPYPKYLDAEFIDSNIAKKNMIFTVAKTPEGKIIGTSAALKCDGAFSGSVLLLLRCIVKNYRGMGIGSEQEKYLFSLIEQRFTDVHSLYADVMTHDSVSQITLFNRGFTLTGFRMMLYRNEIIVPHLPYERGTKMTQAVYCKAIQKNPVSISVPAQHKDFIVQIYNTLGVPCTVEVSGMPVQGESVYHVEEDGLNQTVEIIITSPGEQNGKLISEITNYTQKGYTAVIYLNMCCGDYTALYQALCQVGFYFTGIKPLSEEGEYLILSHTENCVCNYENIALPKGKKAFLNYIVGGVFK